MLTLATNIRHVAVRAQAILLLAITFLMCSDTVTYAEIEKHMALKDGRATPYFRANIIPPAGWIVDATATSAHDMQIYVPNDMTFHTAPALMYVKVSYNSDGRDLGTFIRTSQERWRAAVPDTGIQEAVPQNRDSGAADYQIYRFRNPSHSQQGYELMAYGEDYDRDGNKFFVMVALTAKSQDALDRAEATYRTSLQTY